MDDHNYAKRKPVSNKMCCLPGCTNRKSNSILLHTFPKDRKVLKAWIHKGRIGWKVTADCKVCSAHFVETDYKIVKNVRSKHLWSFAVPSLSLPPCSTILARQISDQFREKRAITRASRSENASNKTEEGAIFVTHDECNECTTKPADPAILQPIEHGSANKAEMTDKSIQVNTIEDFLPKRSVLDVITSEEQLNSWTGIPTFAILEAIIDCVLNVLKEDGSKAAILKVKILVVFVKMKSNMSFVNMSPIFNLSATTLSRNFKAFLPIVRAAMKSCIYFPCISDIFFVISALTNLTNPILADDKF